MGNVNVYLDCRNSANNDPNNGYTNTQTTNNTTYCFKYSGGTDGNGGVTEITGTGASSITVTVGGDPRYVIDSIAFSGTDIRDLSWAPGANPHIGVITDLDVHDADDYYSVQVLDTVANCTFTCDPQIKNKPPA